MSDFKTFVKCTLEYRSKVLQALPVDPEADAWADEFLAEPYHHLDKQAGGEEYELLTEKKEYPRPDIESMLEN